jgi:hypothetical protein
VPLGLVLCGMHALKLVHGVFQRIRRFGEDGAIGGRFGRDSGARRLCICFVVAMTKKSLSRCG